MLGPQDQRDPLAKIAMGAPPQGPQTGQGPQMAARCFVGGRFQLSTTLPALRQCPLGVDAFLSRAHPREGAEGASGWLDPCERRAWDTIEGAN